MQADNKGRLAQAVLNPQFRARIAGKSKKWIFGNQKDYGILTKIIMYVLLLAIGYVFLYPLLVLLSTSFKSIYDLSNPLVNWIPETFYFENYKRAYIVMGGMEVIIRSLLVMGLTAVIQTLVSALVGYGLAKYPSWATRIILALVLIMFLIPGDLLYLPQYVMYTTLKIKNTLWPLLLPTSLGQGLSSSVFIFIFYQFFCMTPKSLDEAAQIDGAGHYRTFWSINLRSATPAIVVSVALSFVWNWNDSDFAGRYLGEEFKTVALALQWFEGRYASQFPFDNQNNPMLRYNNGVLMAGTILSLIPLLALYIPLEKKLVESIDQTGITGE